MAGPIYCERTSEISQAQALRQAESALQLSKAVLKSASAQHEQAGHAVTTLEPLVNQRGARAAAVKSARYNLDNCRVYAPFEARVTNLTISEGAYAHIGQQMLLSLTQGPGGPLVIFVKASSRESCQECKPTFM
jgi:multidrug efflux system membrane fusion protein